MVGSFYTYKEPLVVYNGESFLCIRGRYIDKKTIVFGWKKHLVDTMNSSSHLVLCSKHIIVLLG